MKVILTSFKEIVSKKGDEYVKCGAIGENGDAFDVFTTKKVFVEGRVDGSSALSKADLTEIFSKYESVDVNFDNNGRVVNVAS